MHRRTRAVIIASSFLSFACATTAPPALESLTDFVVDGTTTRTEVAARLGSPAGYFEQERIAVYFLGYRLTMEPTSPYKPVPAVNIMRPGFSGCAIQRDCERQLILQYDDSDRVVRHVLH
jgi:hypothetical protein